MTTDPGRLLQLKAWLSEAELARHQIATSNKIITISYSVEGSMSRQFNQSSLDQLDGYIQKLKSEIASLGGGGLARRPIIWA